MRTAFLDLLACPSCSGALREEGQSLRCGGCGAGYVLSADIPDLRLPADRATEGVRAFYSDAPFPGYPPRDSLAALRARAGRSELAQLLDAAIGGAARILDLGCGTGQLGLYLATADRLVVGADLTRASLELAAGAARRYGVGNALFVETDLRAPGLQPGKFDVVLCTGVLHHTPDPRASFRALPRLLLLGVASEVSSVALSPVVSLAPTTLRCAALRHSRFAHRVVACTLARDHFGERVWRGNTFTGFVSLSSPTSRN